MVRYECSTHGIILKSETTPAEVPPGRNCEKCGEPVARCVGRP